MCFDLYIFHFASGPHVRPKLLAGLYGGYFKVQLLGPEMGLGPHAPEMCCGRFITLHYAWKLLEHDMKTNPKVKRAKA